MRLRLSLSLLVLVSSFGCQDLYQAKRPYDVYAKPVSFFEPLVSGKEAGTPLILENQAYPIELQLFQDKTFHYHLARLGDGTGTWAHKDGYIELYAERKIFVMRMQMHSVSPDPQNQDVSLEFSDRFGPKFLPLTRKN